MVVFVRSWLDLPLAPRGPESPSLRASIAVGRGSRHLRQVRDDGPTVVSGARCDIGLAERVADFDAVSMLLQFPPEAL